MSLPTVLISHTPPDEIRERIGEVLQGAAELVAFPEVAEARRVDVLQTCRAVLTYHPFRDLGIDSLVQLKNCGLMQCLTAGIDYLPLSEIPDHILVAYNAGAFAKPMAEHVVAMALAGSKRLRIEHGLMKDGEFNQFVPTKKIAGATCGILGFGETGREVARLVQALGMRVEAINRSGKTDKPIDFIGTLDDLERVLENADVLVVTLALTKQTDRLLGAEQFRQMKSDAVLVNVARGEIADEDDLYAHLLTHPRFTACLEAWWIEPVRHGKFEMKHSFLDLPNVIASPHNSGMTNGALITAAERGAQNVLRFLRGEEPRFIATDDVKMG